MGEGGNLHVAKIHHTVRNMRMNTKYRTVLEECDHGRSSRSRRHVFIDWDRVLVTSQTKKGFE